MKNYFLGAFPEDKDKDELRRYLFDPHAPAVKSVTAKHDLHITVGYLGAVPEEVIPEIAEILKATMTYPAVSLSIAGLDFYGSERSGFAPGVRLVDNTGILGEIHRTLNQALLEKTGYGFHNNHDFTPHVTLQRFRNDLSRKEIQRIRVSFKGQSVLPYIFEIKELRLLYKDPVLRRYTALETYPLKRSS